MLSNYIKFTTAPIYYRNKDKDLISQITETLFAQKKVVLCGPPCAGKTFMAHHIAKTILQSEKQTVVRWLDCGNRSKLEFSLKKLAYLFDIEDTYVNINYLLEIQKGIQLFHPKKLVLIFDNLNNMLDISHITSFLANTPENTHVIITTQLENLKAIAPSFAIEPYTLDEMFQYLVETSQLPKEMLERSRDKIFSIMEKDKKDAYNIADVNHFASYVKNVSLPLLKRNPEFPFMLLELTHSNFLWGLVDYKEPHGIEHFYHVFAILDNDFIELDFLKNLMTKCYNISDKNFEHILRALENYSIVYHCVDFNGNRGIMFNSLVQKVIKEQYHADGAIFDNVLSQIKGYMVKMGFCKEKHRIRAINSYFHAAKLVEFMPSFKANNNRLQELKYEISICERQLKLDRLKEVVKEKKEIDKFMAGVNVLVWFLADFLQHWRVDEPFCMLLDKLKSELKLVSRGEALISAGITHTAFGKYENAVGLLQQARDEVLGENVPNITHQLMVHYYKGLLHCEKGEPVDAMACFAQFLGIYEKNSKVKMSYFSADVYHFNGLCQCEIGQTVRGLQSMRAALEERRKLSKSKKNKPVLESHEALGAWYQRTGMPKEAINEFRSAARYYKNIYGWGHYKVIWNYGMIAAIYEAIQKPKKAEKYLKKADKRLFKMSEEEIELYKAYVRRMKRNFELPKMTKVENKMDKVRNKMVHLIKRQMSGKQKENPMPMPTSTN